MSHDAFLATIRAAPADDLPRLVYADWLDEHGDPARAEFVRVQCELAQLGEIAPRRPGLEDREHALLAANEPAWRGFPAGAVAEWEFRRGFVDQVAVSTDGLLHPPTGAALARHPVRRLAIGDATYATDDAARMGRVVAVAGPILAGVEQLDLSGWFRPQSEMMPLFAPGVLPRLRSLAMAGVFGSSRVPGFLRAAAPTPGLTELDVGSGVDLHGPPAVPDFLAALGAARLRALGMANYGLTSADLALLLASPTLSSVTALDIGRNDRLGTDAWQAFRDADPALRPASLDVSGTLLGRNRALGPLLDTPALEQLTDLDVSDCRPGPRFCGVLAASAYWTRARSLRLRAAAVTPRVFEPLCRALGPPALRLLDLGDNPLGADSVRLLCAAPWAESLTWLALAGNDLGDDAVQTLARSGRFPHLRTLHLGHNRELPGGPITDAGALALARAPGLARLRLLTLDGTAVTDAGVRGVIDGEHWNLSGLSLAGCDLMAAAVHALAASPKLARLEWLDLSRNPWLGGRALDVLAASPYLSPLCELDVQDIDLDGRTRDALRDRLGVRLSD